jgi:hypothetical protein
VSGAKKGRASPTGWNPAYIGYGRAFAAAGQKMTDDDFLTSTTLNASEWRGVLDLANALNAFDPLTKRGKLGQEVADRLVAMGLAETIPCSAGYDPRQHPVGYRLTDLGWQVRERGRYPKTSGRS